MPLSVRWLVVSTIALSALPGSAIAAKKPLKVSVTPASAAAGTPLQVRVTGASKRLVCRVTVKSGKKVVFSVRFRARKGKILKTGEATLAGKRQVVVKCGSRKYRRTVSVTAASKVPTPPSTTQPADSHDERYTDTGVPDDILSQFPLPQGVGGEGFATKIPLPTGFRAQVTQGQGGSLSHGSPNARFAIDLGAGAGTPVHAGFGGVVVRAVTGCVKGDYGCGDGLGNNVLLRAVDGTCAVHAHLSSVAVTRGQNVGRYAVLGAVGETGYAYGAHLHYTRNVCNTAAGLAWGFDEAGVPAEGSWITSQNGPPPAPAPAPAPTPTPAPTPAPKTVAETTGPSTNKTFTYYHNAGAPLGPELAPYTTVQISCKLHGFKVSNGNTWWYRIASSPWNDKFWATADAFYNNGAKSGPLAGTPFVDAAVPDC